MIHDQSTIAAIATAMAPAGIGIIRVSGEDAVAIGDAIFRNRRGERILSDSRPGLLRYGIALDADGLQLDEIMAVVFRAPHSYTGEDMVELHCHGGMLVLQRVLDAVLHAGARMAEPGEFTRRAFLNGRMDLAQAEAVMDIVGAENDFALKSAEGQLNGRLSAHIRSLREKLLHEAAFIEAALDDPESYADALDDYDSRLSAVVREVSGEVDELLAHADEGILLREGVRTAIIGPPNAGKSSILNLLTGRDRSIVSDIPGTTRDTVEERVRIGGISLLLIDTAGIDGGSDRAVDVVEQHGIDRALKALEEAELILFVVDRAAEIKRDTLELFSKLRERRVLVIANKTDLTAEVPLPDILQEVPVVYLSAKTGEGLQDLRDAVTAMLFSDEGWRTGDLVITHARHRQLLTETARALEKLTDTIAKNLSEDFYTVDLMDAYRALGEILGEEVGEDLVDKIFSEFCMGK